MSSHKNFSTIFLCSCFAFCVNASLAQINNVDLLTSTDTSSFSAVVASWGGQVTDFGPHPVMLLDDGELAPADACDGVMPDARGSILLLDGEGCDSKFKVQRAEEAGAVAVVICPVDPASELTTFSRTSEPVIGDLPVFLMPYSACQKIKLAAQKDEIKLEFGNKCERAANQGKVIWGAEPGQGDFDGGLNGWTIEGESYPNWLWTDNTYMYGYFTSRIVEGSACNGYVQYKSDEIDDQSDTKKYCSIQSDFCAGSLISPTINLSVVEQEDIFVNFYHEFRHFVYGSTSLILSYDDGMTWTDSIPFSVAKLATEPFNPEINDNTACLPPTHEINQACQDHYSIPIKSYNGQSSIKLKFRHIGDYYYATIDDVTITEGNYKDLAIIKKNYGLPPATVLPSVIPQHIPSYVEIEKRGNLDTSELRIQATSINGFTNLSITNLIDGFNTPTPHCTKEDFLLADKTHLSPDRQGIHTIEYINITNGDQVDTNDTLSYNYEVSHYKWITVDRPLPINRDEESNDFLNVNPQEPFFGNRIFNNLDWLLAYSFYKPKGRSKEYLKSVRVGIESQEGTRGNLKIYLYEWNPTSASFPESLDSGNYIIAAEDTELVGCMGENALEREQNSQPFAEVLREVVDYTDMTFGIARADKDTGQPSEDENGDQQYACLKEDQLYVLAFAFDNEYNSISEGPPIRMLANKPRHDLPINNQLYNRAMDELDIPVRIGSCLSSKNYLDENNFIEDFNNFTFDINETLNEPWIELKFGDSSYSPCPRVSTSEQYSNKQFITIFPNPTTNHFKIVFDKASSEQLIELDLFNLTGGLVMPINIEEKSDEQRIDVSQLPAGVYIIKARTTAGVFSKKIVVQ